MSEKVFLTKSQVNVFKQWPNKEQLILAKVTGLLEQGRDEPIADLSVEDIVKAVYIGYEIEPEEPKFEVGDKVFVDWIDGGKVHQVAAVKNHGQVILQRAYALNCLPLMDIVRHATKEEIFWLEELGRDKVGDFRVGDVYVDENGIFTTIDLERHVSLAQEWHESGDFCGLYPAESFRPFKKEPSNGNH